MPQGLLRRMGRRLLWRRKHSREIPFYERDGYVTVFDDDAMTVLQMAGRAEECIVSFTGIGHALGGLDLQTPEFSRSGGDENKIFVIDKQRSWGNNLDWDRLVVVVKELAGSAPITTLGNSMGGFLAILSARQLQAARTIAFAPQWSIDKAIMPQEKRWAEYRNKIGSIRFPDVSTGFNNSTQFNVFFGNNPRDEAHLRLFPRNRANVSIVVVEGCGHDVAKFLKEKGQLYSVLDTCRTGGDAHGLLEAAGVHSRIW